MDEKNMERIYALLERAEREHDTETAAALRWAIFQLENKQSEYLRRIITGGGFATPLDTICSIKQMWRNAYE